MFVGHFAPACVAATHRKAPSLPILFLGAQLIDWAFFGLLSLGVEKARLVPGISAMNPMDLYSMPYTHSLVGTLAFAGALACLIRAFSKSWTGAAIGFGVVVSHWVLDLLVHIPDLTLAGQPPKLGFGLWNHPFLEMPLELGITGLGLWVYARATGGMRPSIWTLAGLLLILQAINWFGPQPTEVTLGITLLAWFGYAVATLGAWWAARTGQVREILIPHASR